MLAPVSEWDIKNSIFSDYHEQVNSHASGWSVWRRKAINLFLGHSIDCRFFRLKSLLEAFVRQKKCLHRIFRKFLNKLIQGYFRSVKGQNMVNKTIRPRKEYLTMKYFKISPYGHTQYEPRWRLWWCLLYRFGLSRKYYFKFWCDDSCWKNRANHTNRCIFVPRRWRRRVASSDVSEWPDFLGGSFRRWPHRIWPDLQGIIFLLFNSIGILVNRPTRFDAWYLLIKEF